ncbi:MULTISPECIES: tyrosine-type recombinase/integrase [Lysinibacillus]|uniref:tyrosine-type recombinase/integrase n=1 Tax=Lysinibacillus TaxID=400634 RepID=UPI00214B06D5|nr:MULTISPECIES: tyrosine-type recombinase/integrase [Lysinibacillus]UUV23431.1 tyrosine-type recombinase/integrase [Lysinibacillus sp. FN11]UYB46301.1 tyrosine-type recombinase/integrase [Lysinibacillus capsici]
MANKNPKEGTLIDVQPLKDKKDINNLIEALGMTKEFGLRNQLLFKLGISTGLRCGDLVALTVEQVKGKSNFKIREGKTKKERTVYLNNLMADIAEYIETLPQGTVYLFPSRKGDGHISTTQAYRIITKAGEMISRNDIGTHTMRKTFGYTYYQATKDVATLMEIFNHSSQKTTLRYIGITEESIENSIKSISFF